MAARLKANVLSLPELIIMGIGGSALLATAGRVYKGLGTKIMGVGGLLIGVVFFRPSGYRPLPSAVPAG